MLNMLFRMKTQKKRRNTAAIGGAVSLAAALGGLITWYTAKRIRRHRENEFLYNQNEESQP